MSDLTRDPSRKVSQPTQADFIRGVASSHDRTKGNASFLAALLISLVGAGRRGSR